MNLPSFCLKTLFSCVHLPCNLVSLFFSYKKSYLSLKHWIFKLIPLISSFSEGDDFGNEDSHFHDYSFPASRMFSVFSFSTRLRFPHSDSHTSCLFQSRFYIAVFPSTLISFPPPRLPSVSLPGLASLISSHCLLTNAVQRLHLETEPLAQIPASCSIRPSVT